MRVANWEKRLKDVISKHQALPSQYGISDCYLIADDAVEAMTGQRMFENIEYSNEIGAAKMLRSHGFENVEQAFACKFENVPPSLAQRGDIGVIDDHGEICGGVFTSVGFMTRDKNKVVFLPVTRVKTAFKVGR